MRSIEPTDILTMTTFEIEIDDEKIHQLLRGDQGMAVLLEPTREPDSTGRDDLLSRS